MCTILYYLTLVMIMATTVTTRVDGDLLRDIKFFAKEEGLDRSAEIRRLLSRDIKQNKVEYALQRYKEKQITIGKAAEIAGIHLREMMILASEKGIDFQYSEKDLEEDFRAAMNGKGNSEKKLDTNLLLSAFNKIPVKFYKLFYSRVFCVQFVQV